LQPYVGEEAGEGWIFMEFVEGMIAGDAGHSIGMLIGSDFKISEGFLVRAEKRITFREIVGREESAIIELLLLLVKRQQ
jgi:hypothetical protein